MDSENVMPSYKTKCWYVQTTKNLGLNWEKIWCPYPIYSKSVKEGYCFENFFYEDQKNERKLRIKLQKSFRTET